MLGGRAERLWLSRPLTFCKTLRNLPKTNVQLPVENITGTNVFLPCGALFYG